MSFGINSQTNLKPVMRLMAILRLIYLMSINEIDAINVNKNPKANL